MLPLAAADEGDAVTILPRLSGAVDLPKENCANGDVEVVVVGGEMEAENADGEAAKIGRGAPGAGPGEPLEIDVERGRPRIGFGALDSDEDAVDSTEPEVDGGDVEALLVRPDASSAIGLSISCHSALLEKSLAGTRARRRLLV